jgi:hypothetical protein
MLVSRFTLTQFDESVRHVERHTVGGADARSGRVSVVVDITQGPLLQARQTPVPECDSHQDWGL